MTQENPNSVTPSGVIPNEPNSDGGKGIPFAIEIPGTGMDVSPHGTYPPPGMELPSRISFNPVYYPDRYTDTANKEVERNGRQCGGEDVSIDQTKNPEFHATGIVLDGNVADFRKVRNYEGPVNLITPLTDNDGGMEVIITKGEIGELVGWDGLYKQWQFKYTLDMVATGADTDDESPNPVVSEILVGEGEGPRDGAFTLPNADDLGD